MEIIDAKKLKFYLLGAKFIGKGSCAFCFLMKNGKVLKIYYDSKNTRYLFREYSCDMIDFFNFLSSFNNQTFYGPNALFVDERVIAYTMEYASGFLGTKLDSNMSILKLEELFYVLESDMISASERNLSLKDVKPKNMIIGENIKIIDLDFSQLNERHATDRLLQFNYREFILALTKAIFKIPENRDVLFYDKNLQNLFIQAVYQDYLAYYELLNTLKKQGETIEDLRQAKLIYSKIHENYNSKGII